MTVSGEIVEVQVLGLPIPIYTRAAAQGDALQREFAFIQSGTPDGSVPQRLLALVEELETRYAGVGATPQAALQAAMDRGDSAIDLTFEIPADIGTASEHLLDLLEEADSYCRAGRDLVTLVTPPEAVAFRRWFLGEFIAQSSGRPATSWLECCRLHSAEVAEVADVTGQPDSVVQSNGAHRIEDPATTTATLAFKGELDMATAESLRRDMNRLREAGHDRIVLDASELTFIDSSGLSVLIAVHLRLADSGGELVISQPRQVLRDALELSGVHDLLTIEPRTA
jgi:anti-sigma B factor antagonist